MGAEYFEENLRILLMMLADEERRRRRRRGCGLCKEPAALSILSRVSGAYVVVASALDLLVLFSPTDWPSLMCAACVRCYGPRSCVCVYVSVCVCVQSFKRTKERMNTATRKQVEVAPGE